MDSSPLSPWEAQLAGGSAAKAHIHAHTHSFLYSLCDAGFSSSSTPRQAVSWRCVEECPGPRTSALLQSSSLYISPFSSAWTIYGKILDVILIILFCGLLKQQPNKLSWRWGKAQAVRRLSRKLHCLVKQQPCELSWRWGKARAVREWLSCSQLTLWRWPSPPQLQVPTIGPGPQESPCLTITSLLTPILNLCLLSMMRYMRMHSHPLLLSEIV